MNDLPKKLIKTEFDWRKYEPQNDYERRIIGDFVTLDARFRNSQREIDALNHLRAELALKIRRFTRA